MSRPTLLGLCTHRWCDCISSWFRLYNFDRSIYRSFWLWSTHSLRWFYGYSVLQHSSLRSSLPVYSTMWILKHANDKIVTKCAAFSSIETCRMSVYCTPFLAWQGRAPPLCVPTQSTMLYRLSGSTVKVKLFFKRIILFERTHCFTLEVTHRFYNCLKVTCR